MGLLFAVVLILSSEVSARELAEAAHTQGSVEDAKSWGHGHGHGHEHEHGHWGHEHGHGHGHGPGHGHGHGHHGHGGAGETVENET
ncbi:hypothetical protein ELJ17_30520, partial [Klebsiella pneumoniae]|nr:hypothetical protein [Klebsiella pneumoniae]